LRKVTIRPAEPRDADNYAAWLKAASDINLVDVGVYQYPTLQTVTVEKAGEPVLMTSYHPVLMVEALAPQPGLSPMDEARALKALFDHVEQAATDLGIREIWFGCADERVKTFATRHGIERVNFPVFRKIIRSTK
jgi:hypothetical protein